MQRVIIATFLAALAVSAWDYLFWSSNIVRDLCRHATEARAAESSAEPSDDDAEYAVRQRPETSQSAMDRKGLANPAPALVDAAGSRPDAAGRMMAVAALTFFPIALVVFVVGGRLRTFATRFLTVALCGAAAALWTSSTYLLMEGGIPTLAAALFFREAVSWCIAGGIIGRLVRPAALSD